MFFFHAKKMLLKIIFSFLFFSKFLDRCSREKTGQGEREEMACSKGPGIKPAHSALVHVAMF